MSVQKSPQNSDKELQDLEKQEIEVIFTKAFFSEKKITNIVKVYIAKFNFNIVVIAVSPVSASSLRLWEVNGHLSHTKQIVSTQPF